MAVVAAMAAGFLLVLYLPPVSHFLALSLGPDRDGLVAVTVGLAAMALLSLLRRLTEPAAERSLVAAGRG
jgi:hypothetical protein